MRRLSHINDYLEEHKVISYLVLFLVAFIFFLYLGQAPTFGDPDSFYHVKMAELMSQKGIIYDFKWLPYTVLANNYIDHHFLYHVYLMPFVKWLPPLVGVKIAHLILTALVVVVFSWLLRKFKIRGAFWFSLLLLLAPALTFRLSLVKAQPLSLIILFVGLYLIVERRLWPLIFLNFVYVWTYDGWFLLPVLTGVYILIWSFDSAWQKQSNWFFKLESFLGLVKKDYLIDFFKSVFSWFNIKLMLSALVGVVFGIVINPYFPQNLNFYWFHIVKIGLLNFQHTIGVGAEWYPYSAWDLMEKASLPFILLIATLILFLAYHKKLGTVVKYLFAVMALFLLATMKSRRNIEYLTPFMVLFSAAVLTASWQVGEVRKDLRQLGRLITKHLFNIKIQKYFLIAVLVVAFILVSFNAVMKTKEALNSGINFRNLKNSAQFLAAVSKPGDIVFHSDWDYWPQLFFYNSHNYYIVGLDPTFIYLSSPELYRKWENITLGKEPENIYQVIKNDFKAQYVYIVYKRHSHMMQAVKNNFFFKEIYHDNEAAIFKVL